MHKDLTGKVYGELTVMSLAGKEKDGHKKWHCKCKCGNEKDIREYSLVHGITTSCGKHKKSTSRLYEIYNGMKKRCYNPKFKFYKHYGGRGITICDSWLEDVINFYNDMEEFYLAHVEKYGEKDTTLDRIDVKPGQKVSAGTQLGLSGDTGNARGMATIPKGAHLHFEVRTIQNPGLGLGGRIDPEPYIKF